MKKRCFVIQGFGIKQDYEQGKQFDLDASYEVIREAIEDAGMECYRADELRTNAFIDMVIYEQLLSADLVVADITTLNFDTAYELGVRLALRPYATLVVAESGMNIPFDQNQIRVIKYQHLGGDIGFREAKRFRTELATLAKEAVTNPQIDSPVYTYLPSLPKNGFIDVALKTRPSSESEKKVTSLRNFKDRARVAMLNSQFTDAVELWQEALKLAEGDNYIIQQLALATYKSQKPDLERSLKKAREILEYLTPHVSSDQETLGLWAAVHKRLFEITKDADALEEALFALERGFFIKQDYYNGINFAYMLINKSVLSDANTREELRAVARYVLRKVKDICNKALENPELIDDEKYWVLATLYEASVGLGQEDEALHWKNKSEEVAEADWMNLSTETQISKLRSLLVS